MRSFIKQKGIYICLLVVIAPVLTIWVYSLIKSGQEPQRISRNHENYVHKDFAYLTQRFCDPENNSSYWLSQSQAREDLDELEWLLLNRFSYFSLTKTEYQSAIDTIRSALKNGIYRDDFGLHLQKYVSLFGDSHSGVSPSVNKHSNGFLPFLMEPIGSRFAAIKLDRSGFVSEGHPFIRKIDGLNIELWLEKARLVIPNGSDQFVKHSICRVLLCIPYLRKELGFPNSDTVSVQFESSDGNTVQVFSLSSQKPKYKSFPFKQNQILQGNFGYLRIPSMSNEPNDIKRLVKWMHKFHETKGLVIDIRGNRGGSRATLKTLFPFFLTDQAEPEVVNIAAYRLGHKKDILSNRWLFPISHQWTETEKCAIEKTLVDFKPQWLPPMENFSDWHFFVIGPSRTEESYYYYNRPVVMLMDGYCHSAADIFVGAFKGRRNVTLIGMLSSGGSGRAKRYMLANSRNQVRLASMISFRPNGMLYEGIGVHPDIYLEKTITDLIGKTDSALDKAIELLSNKISATSIQNMDFNEELGKITVDYSMSDEGLQVR